MNSDNGFIVGDCVINKLIKSLKDKPIDINEHRHIHELGDVYISLKAANDQQSIFQEMFSFKFSESCYSISFRLKHE